MNWHVKRSLDKRERARLRRAPIAGVVLSACVCAVATLGNAAKAQGTGPAVLHDSAQQNVADTGMTTVMLTPDSGRTLLTTLKAEIRKANSQGRAPFVELGAEWCIPCQEIKALLDPPIDAKIADIFAGTYVIRLDIDQWNDGEQKTLGLVSPHGIPAFFAIDNNGAATATMAGDEWGENTADGLQPLKQFFRRHRHDPRDQQIGDSANTPRR